MISNEYINNAIDYIMNHITENITVDEISRYCNFSRYYFSRMFKLETGESIYEFVKRMKIEQSAFRLKVEKRRSITEVSSDYGYSSSNYSVTFKKHYNLTPIEFRRNILKKSLQDPIYDQKAVGLEPYEECCKKISIRNILDRLVIYQRYKGNYSNISEHWGEFQERYKEYITESTLFLERTYDDPSITDIDECLYDICMTAPEGCETTHTYILKGGKYAVYDFTGHVKQIYTAYQNIFHVWLPKSGYRIDERYSFDRYKKIDCDSMIMEMELCIPVK